MADRLLEVVWVSLVAGVGITTVFSLVIHFAARSDEHRRGGQERAAVGYAALSVLALALFAAGVVYGVQVMLAK